jgi:hypothetical protein
LRDQGFLFVLKRREVDRDHRQFVGLRLVAERQCGLGRGIEFIHEPLRERFRIKPSERRRPNPAWAYKGLVARERTS